MPYNVLFLPLLAGYIFILNFNPFSYWARRQSSYHILFASAIAGFGILCINVALTALLTWQIPREHWAQLFGIDWLIPSLACIPLSLLLLLLNYIPYFGSRKSAERAAKKRNDSLELLFIKGLLDQIPVALSLKSGKVYIGYITAEGDTNTNERKQVRILPMLSGYRHADTKELNVTTNYAATIQKLDYELPVPYDIVIPIIEIETARFHDEALFSGFQNNERDKI